MPKLSFSQVDVFAGEEFKGNPVAVVHDADALSDQQMLDFARWTNLSETTFLLHPTQADADYRLRIFTPGGELPFAGHPTLGSCHAWLEQTKSGERASREKGGTEIVQECALGLVNVRKDDGLLAFAAPPLLRSGPLEASLVDALTVALGLPSEAVLDHQWVDNGPGWCALLLDGAARVNAVQPDLMALGGHSVGIVGALPSGSTGNFEVRAFVPSLGVPEDPVTGSLNAGLAQWLMAEGIAGDSYLAHQGTVIERAGRVHLRRIKDAIWVGGSTRTVIRGKAEFG